MTESEIFSIMTAGLATVAGGVMAVFMIFVQGAGIPPGHLMTASVMSAPAALAISKIWHPETEKPKTSSGNIDISDYDPTGGSANLGITAGLMASFSTGLIQGGQLVMNIV